MIKKDKIYNSNLLHNFLWKTLVKNIENIFEQDIHQDTIKATYQIEKLLLTGFPLSSAVYAGPNSYLLNCELEIWWKFLDL